MFFSRETKTSSHPLGAIVLSALVLLSGCGGGGGEKSQNDGLTSIAGESTNDDVAHSDALVSGHYPADEQGDIPLHAQLVIFSDHAATAELDVSVEESATGETVALTKMQARPGETRFQHKKFKAATRYKTTVRSKTQSFSFSFETSAYSARNSESKLVYSELDDGSATLTTYSTLHFSFSAPLNRKTVNTNTVSLMQNKQEIAINVFSDGRQIVVDPLDPLQADKEYTLRLAGMVDSRDQAVAPYSGNFTPVDLGTLSPINTTVGPASLASLSSNILGEQETKMQGTLTANLADPDKFNGFNPIVIKKGSLLSAQELSLLLGGKVPLPQSTGKLYFQLLADSVATLSRNSLLESIDSPSNVRATFDLTLSTEDESINSFFSQQLLRVEMVGVATLKKGGIEFSLSGAAGLEILDDTPIEVTIALQLNSDIDAAPTAHKSAPRLNNTLPSDGQNQVPLGERLTLIFDRPIDPSSLRGNLEILDQNLFSVPFQQIYDGAKLHLHPLHSWAPNTQHTLRALEPILDLSGAALAPLRDRHFTTIADPAQNLAPVVLLNISPGVPCSLKNPDYINGTAGSCLQSGESPVDIFEHPHDLALSANFSSSLDASSITIASDCNTPATLALLHMDWSSGTPRCLSAVPMTLKHLQRAFTLQPDSPLTIGASYQLRINAGADGICDPGELCGKNGAPLNTQYESNGYHVGGGDPITLPFIAVAADTQQTLLKLSTRYPTDTNGNGIKDGSEEKDPGASIAMKIDLCDSSFCSKPGGLLSSPICDGPGDSSPTDDRYSCNDDMPRTALGLLAVTGVRYSDSGISYMHATTRIHMRPPVTGHRLYGDVIPVSVEPMLDVASGLSLVINKLLDIPVRTGPLALQIFPIENPEFPGTHAWINNDANGNSIFSLPVDIYVSAPFLTVPTGGTHNLRQTKISLTMSSPVALNKSGDITVKLRNKYAEKLTVKIGGTLFGVANGDLVFDMPPGSVSLDLYGRQSVLSTEAF